MNSLDEFSEITRRDESLARHTWLKVGGPAEYFIEPRSLDEFTAVVQACHAAEIPVRLLGSGSNLLVRDEGVSGAVIRLAHPAFAETVVEGNTVRCGGGAKLTALISRTVEAGLAGLEVLTGIPGTVGGALHGNAGGQSGDIGQYVKTVEVLTAKGERCRRTQDELFFGYRESSLNELAILEAEFELSADDPDEITRRMRKLWIMKKATQPLSFQSAGCMFKNPRGFSAGTLIERCGLKGTKVGQAEISDRHANFFVTHEGAKSADLLELVSLVQQKVAQEHGVDLELEIEIW